MPKSVDSAIHLSRETLLTQLMCASKESATNLSGVLSNYDLDRGSDPPPGWETMWKGVQKLRMWAEGYELGAE